ncbi:MAG TPA: hypothetical protein VFW79_10735 [Cellulomonas sp.]|uniref:hypothetical protein n=1 Tax=Cellulomonas sp. TaxID=40001 RepID=UPI002E3333BF|nr:hypothetical protein [Cellulomonas sp.]HEX5333107.1 hypothetical protein [Cellulomonas sp.]
MAPHEALVESVRVRERAALARLDAAAGGASLCSMSHAGASVPAVKYHEGASSALAEARRAVKGVAQGPGAALEARTVLLEIRDRWRAQCGTPGRTGGSWAGYLTGGLDALDELLDDEGHGAQDARN